jgi:hypothetical protein
MALDLIEDMPSFFGIRNLSARRRGDVQVETHHGVTSLLEAIVVCTLAHFFRNSSNVSLGLDERVERSVIVFSVRYISRG